MRHYIIFGAVNDYLKASYKDISDAHGAIYQTEFLPDSPTWIKKIHTAHCLSSVAVKKKLPLKKLWYKKYYSKPYQKSDEYVFVFLNLWAPIFQNGYINYLKEKYPGCKCVLFLCDINNARKLNIEEEKKRFDHIMVFERNFAKEHNIAYYPLVYSDFRDEVNLEEKTIDLLFVGLAKGRYKFLKQIYDRLTASGVNCQFYMTKLDKEGPQASGIHTMDYVPYSQYLELLKKAKCLLDIIPPDTDCNTIRVNEAMSYKCKILTNNEKIVFEEFFDPKSISIYQNLENIDIDFLLEQYVDTDYDGYITKMGPKALTQYLDKVLFEQGDKAYE